MGEFILRRDGLEVIIPRWFGRIHTEKRRFVSNITEIERLGVFIRDMTVFGVLIGIESMEIKWFRMDDTKIALHRKKCQI